MTVFPTKKSYYISPPTILLFFLSNLRSWANIYPRLPINLKITRPWKSTRLWFPPKISCESSFSCWKTRPRPFCSKPYRICKIIGVFLIALMATVWGPELSTINKIVNSTRTVKSKFACVKWRPLTLPAAASHQIKHMSNEISYFGQLSANQAWQDKRYFSGLRSAPNEREVYIYIYLGSWDDRHFQQPWWPSPLMYIWKWKTLDLEPELL